MADDAFELREAAPEDADLLTGLAMRSKAHWGYSSEFMDACRAELTVSRDRVRSGEVRYVVVERQACVIGFYGLSRRSDSEFELEALFVEPAQIGGGFGRALMRHALAAVAAQGGRALVVQGDPNAERFYRAAGGVLSGTRESGSIRGRHLPLFTIPVEPEERNCRAGM